MIEVDFADIYLPTTIADKIYTTNLPITNNAFLASSYSRCYDGKGEIIFKNGNKYEGDISHGMLHGNGRLTWSSGVIYAGNFNQNIPEGVGTYYWPDGSSYDGEIKQTVRHGVGTFKSAGNEVCYEGTWKMGVRHGIGKLTYSSGACYEGDFYEGKKHGKGKYTYPSKDYYEGEWQNDKKHGKGVMVWKSKKEKYIGDWQHNTQEGYGVHLFFEEDVNDSILMLNRYEGHFHEGKRNGFGAFFYSNGSKYEGEWLANLKSGLAKYTDELGNFYFAIFAEDKICEVLYGTPVQLNTDYRYHEITDKSENNSVQVPEKEKDKLRSVRIQRGKSPVANPKTPKDKNKKGILKPPSAVVEPLKPAVIDKNPYVSIIDVSKSLKYLIVKEGLQNKNISSHINLIYQILIRHNSTLKSMFSFLKNFIGCHSDEVFTFRLGLLWEFLMKTGCFTPSVSLARINRLFIEEKLNNFTFNFNIDEFFQEVELMGLTSRCKTEPLNEKKLEQKKHIVHNPTIFMFQRNFLDFLLKTVMFHAKSIEEYSVVLNQLITKWFSNFDTLDLTVDFIEPFHQNLKEVFYIVSGTHYKSKFNKIDETGFIRDLVNFLKKVNAFEEEKFLKSLLFIWPLEELKKKLTREILNYEYTLAEFSVFFSKYVDYINLDLNYFLKIDNKMQQVGIDPLLLAQKRISINDFSTFVLPRLIQNEKMRREIELQLMIKEDVNIRYEWEKDEKGKKKKNVRPPTNQKRSPQLKKLNKSQQSI